MSSALEEQLQQATPEESTAAPTALVRSSRHHRRWRGLAFYAVTLALLVVANFWLPRGLPGDPLASMEEPSARSYVADPEIRAKVAAYYGLDQPLLLQFEHYVGGLARGDLGWSIQYNQPVTSILVERVPWSLLLILTATVLAGLAALVAGVESGWRRGSRADRSLVVAFVLLENIPIYLLAVLMLIAFSVKLNLFPLGGASQPFTDFSPGERAIDVAWHLALPAFVLALEMVGGGYLLMRNSMVTVLGSDYMGTTRAMGLLERTRKYRYAMRNAILPFSTLVSLQVAMAVSGTIFVETVFAYPGVGQLMFQAIQFRDYPLLEGGFLVFGIWVLVINAVADQLLTLLDPRLRVHG